MRLYYLQPFDLTSNLFHLIPTQLSLNRFDILIEIARHTPMLGAMSEQAQGTLRVSISGMPLGFLHYKICLH